MFLIIVLIGVGLIVGWILHEVLCSLLSPPQITLEDPDLSDIRDAAKPQNIDVQVMYCPDCNSTQIKCNDNEGPFVRDMEDKMEARGSPIYNHSYMCMKCGKYFTSIERLVKSDNGPTPHDYQDSELLWED